VPYLAATLKPRSQSVGLFSGCNSDRIFIANGPGRALDLFAATGNESKHSPICSKHLHDETSQGFRRLIKTHRPYQEVVSLPWRTSASPCIVCALHSFAPASSLNGASRAKRQTRTSHESLSLCFHPPGLPRDRKYRSFQCASRQLAGVEKPCKPGPVW